MGTLFEPPVMDASIILLHVGLRLIWKDDMVQLPYPVLSLGAPLLLCVFILLYHETLMAVVQIVRSDNTLTKYQMIKFIDFCEVWFLPESVSQSSRHCWRSPLPHASGLIQTDFGCVLGVQQTKQLLHVAKVDLVSQLRV
ncbi:hypothetical protein TNCV_4746031 [Trichonephila clavipes]|nr:hypothetical protein TNCV_4746031 [Trichonephila clavipes]